MRHHDGSRALICVHHGAGDGVEWAEMVVNMYVRWAQRRGLTATELPAQPGIRKVVVDGVHAYRYLAGETGTHRLVRRWPTDPQRRRHTCFANVVVTLVDENDACVASWQPNPDVLGPIRSYVLDPYERVSDHRTDLHMTDAKGVLDGDLNVFMVATMTGPAPLLH